MSFLSATKPMPLVDLLVSTNPPESKMNMAVAAATAQENPIAHNVRGTAAVARHALLRPDDSQVPPEPGAISEQPELSHMRQMTAELEMHRQNAKSGVNYVSRSERYSESLREKKPMLKTTRTTEQLERKTQRPRSGSQRAVSRSLSSGYYSGDSSVSQDRRSYDSEHRRHNNRHGSAGDGGATGRRKSRSHNWRSRSRPEASRERSWRSVGRHGNSAAAIQSDNEKRVSTDAQQYNGGDNAQHATCEQQKQKQEEQQQEQKPKQKVDSIKQFFSKNMMLIVATIVVLALVGIGIYLLFKGNRESSKHADMRRNQQSLLEEEQTMQSRDTVIEEIRQQNEVLNATNAQNTQVIQAYDAQLNQFGQQNELQMQAIEKINAEKAAYQQAIVDWENYYQGQQQQQQQQEEEQQEVEQQSNVAATAVVVDQRSSQQEHHEKINQKRSDEAAGLEPSSVIGVPFSDEKQGLVVNDQGEWISAQDNPQYVAPQTPPTVQQIPLEKTTTTPNNLPPPVENRRQPPLMMLAEGTATLDVEQQQQKEQPIVQRDEDVGAQPIAAQE